MATIENNNVIEVGMAGLNRTLKELASEVRQRPGVQGLPRVYFRDGADAYRMLLQESNLGFNVSGSLNGATAYQMNRTIFDMDEEVGRVILKIAAAPAGATAAEFFA